MTKTAFPRLIVLILILSLLIAVFPAGAASTPKINVTPTYKSNVAFDISPALRDVAKRPAPLAAGLPNAEAIDFRPDRSLIQFEDQGYSGDAALQKSMAAADSLAALTSDANFEGISNQDNFNLFGFRVNPPDPVGDVGPNHYVEMVNLAFAVYDKQGNLLLGPVDTGALWAGFPIQDCTDPSGDPIVVYDQFADRWLLSQFTTRGTRSTTIASRSLRRLIRPGLTTATHSSRRKILTFPGRTYFPDYPKYSVWNTSYIMTTRDFGDGGGYGISVYALEKNKMVNGEANVGVVQFFLDSDIVPLELLGDGLLPADIDGNKKPLDHSPVPIFGTQDDDYPYGATFDALNIYEMYVKWNSGVKGPVAWLNLVQQIPVAEFDSAFPCGPSRGCIPQPGHHQSRPVPGYPVLPPAPDFPPGLPQLRQVRVDGHIPIGGSNAWYGRDALVRSTAGQRPVLAVPTGYLRTRRQCSPLDGQHRPG